MHTTRSQACGAIGAINCAFVTTLAPKSGMQPQTCDILKMCLWENKYCDCIDYSGDHHGKRALLQREDGQRSGYQAWRFAIVLTVFLLVRASSLSLETRMICFHPNMGLMLCVFLLK